MAPVANDSFDAIVAKAVLQHVYDDDAALDEMRRVLKPGVACCLQVHHLINAYTERAVDQTWSTTVTATDAYKVGTYRIYGDPSLLPSFQARFLVKTFHARDPISGTLDCIFSCMKPFRFLLRQATHSLARKQSVFPDRTRSAAAELPLHMTDRLGIFGQWMIMKTADPVFRPDRDGREPTPPAIARQTTTACGS